jgi:hypothetical protein
MSSSSEAVAMPWVQLVATAPDEGTRIDVYDGDLHRVETEQNLGEVSLKLPPGVYCVTFTRGNDSVRKTRVLDEPGSTVSIRLTEDEAPRFATAAPVRKTSSTREFHRYPARDLSLQPPLPPPAGQAGGSRLFVFARDLERARTGDPARGLSLRDVDGKLLYDLSQTNHRNPADGWAAAHLDLDPGVYLLRSEPRSGRITEQAIYTRAGWQTQVFLLSRSAGAEGKERRTDLSNVSLLMARSNVGFDFEREDLRWTEVALSALDSDGNIPGTLRTDMLWAKFENPILGIFAALLQLRRKKIDVAGLKYAVGNLLGLVGPLPDVLAIGWALVQRDESLLKDSAFMQPLNDPKALTTPPLLAESWTHLMRASEQRPDLIPRGSLSDRVGDLNRPRGPWLTWRGEPPKSVDLGDPAAEVRGVAQQARERLAAEGLATAAAAQGSLLGAHVTGGLLGGLLEKFREPLSEITSGVALPYLRTLLSNNPEVGYLVASRRYTDLERRIAFFVYPQAAPALRELMDASKRIAEAWSEDEPVDTSVKNAIETLGVPASTLLRATWSLLKKLLVQPVVPLKLTASAFAESEAHGVAALKKMLMSLADEPTPLRPRAGPLYTKGLAFLCLYYRGSPAYSTGTTHGVATLASLLNDSEYVWSDELAPITAVLLTKQVDALRDRLLKSIASALKTGELELDDGWEQQVLPPLSAYERGKLLPAPHPEPAPSSAAAPGAPTPPRKPARGTRTSPRARAPAPVNVKKWIRIPAGSWIELKVDGEHVAASAHLKSADGSVWHVADVTHGMRRELRTPTTYALRVDVAFAVASLARVECRIVRPDGSTHSKPYTLELSGKADDVAHAVIVELTVKS